MKLVSQTILSYINKIILITTYITAQSIFCMIPGPQMPGLPNGPQFGSHGPQPMNGQGGGMQMPSDAELEAMFKEIEKIAAENPEIIKEWEREGQRAIMAMSDAELNEFSHMMGINPSELREEAARALAGESAPTTQPEPQQPIKNTSHDNMPEKITETPPIKASKKEIENVKGIIQALISDLSRIQRAASSVREIYEMVRSWSQELRDLMFYLRVIDNDNHYNQLVATEFKNLVKTLTQLHNDIASEISYLILPDDLSRKNTPYDLLGLQSKASEKEIIAAYEKLAQVNNPKELEKNLRALATPEESIKRLVKAARINFEVIEEAYEQLSDAKSRKQLDRTIQAEQKVHKQQLERALDSLTKITTSLSQALYTKQLLTELERFLLQYAPKEAALKKQLQDAEKKRTEEQKRREGMRATETSGRYEQNVSYKPAPSNDYGYHSDFPSYYGGRDWERNLPDFSYGGKKWHDDEKKSEEPKTPTGQKPAEKTKEEKEREEKAGKETAEKQAAQKKSNDLDKRDISVVMNDIKKTFDTIIKQYGPDIEGINNKSIINNFEAYAQQKTGDIISPTEYSANPARKMSEAEQKLSTDELLKKNLEEILPATTPRSVKQITKKAVIAQVDPAQSNHLKDLEKNLKLEQLSQDLETITKKIKIEKTKFTPEQEKKWKSITELYEKPKKATTSSSTKKYVKSSLEEIGKKIETAYASMTPEKQEAHKDAVGEFLGNIHTIKEKYQALNKTFEE